MEENWIKVLMELEAIEEKLKLQEDKNEHQDLRLKIRTEL